MKQAVQNAVDYETLCRSLQWDSDFFGCNIASVTSEFLESAQHEQVRLWCESNAIDCLYFLANSDSENVNLAQTNGFALRDVRVTLERSLGNGVNAAAFCESLTPYVPADLDDLRAIARAGHCDTRFYRDRNFPPEMCNRLYETWIEKSCQGQADAVFVARLTGRAVGYVTCHLETNSDVATGSIGLVGVALTAQRKGFGQALIETALCWFGEHGVERVTVVTQGHNVAAQRLYQRCGFATCDVRFWFHRWFR